MNQLRIEQIAYAALTHAYKMIDIRGTHRKDGYEHTVNRNSIEAVALNEFDLTHEEKMVIYQHINKIGKELFFPQSITIRRIITKRDQKRESK